MHQAQHVWLLHWGMLRYWCCLNISTGGHYWQQRLSVQLVGLFTFVCVINRLLPGMTLRTLVSQGQGLRVPLASCMPYTRHMAVSKFATCTMRAALPIPLTATHGASVGNIHQTKLRIEGVGQICHSRIFHNTCRQANLETLKLLSNTWVAHLTNCVRERETAR